MKNLLDHDPPKSRPTQPSLVRPIRMAAAVTLGYCFVSTGYVFFSTWMASKLSESVFELKEIEKFKGVAFVCVTSLLLFWLTTTVFKRLEIKQRTLEQATEGLAALERHAAAGLLASTVGHDVNNLLTICECGLAELAEEEATEDKQQVIRHLQDANEQLRRLASRLLKGAKSTLSDQAESFDLVQVTKDILKLSSNQRWLRGCSVHLDAPERLLMEGDRTLISQMILNLLNNAADATQHRGTIRVGLREEGDVLVLVVDDNGEGVRDDEKNRIFDAFYTTKDHGAGLGLLSVKRGASIHGGSVQLRESDLGGACFEVRLAKKSTPLVMG